MMPGLRRATVVATVALSLLSAAVLVWQRSTHLASGAGPVASLDGLTVELTAAGWVEMGHVTTGPGFTMPDQMMPGAPSGDEIRLGISITLSNTDSAARRFNLAEEFLLVGGPLTEPLPMSADTIGVLPRLSAGAFVRGILYFDLVAPADSDPPLYLMWARAGSTVEIPVPAAGTAPSHEHR